MPPNDDTPGPPASEIRLDPRSLRGIAHPLRMRLLGLLRAHGPATATLLADRVGASTGATSYHLRQLAAYGFVEEESGRGSGRERWWRAVHRTTRYGAALASGDASAAEAGEAFLRTLAMQYADETQRALDEWSTLPDEWRAPPLADFALRLTPAEFRALQHRLTDLLVGYREDDPERIAQAPQGSQPVRVLVEMFRRPGGPPAEGQ
jgi:DNA-binding transcriptional ArsR family regulator